ncbi:hypothetical protein Peur_052300 [Populus x canadensis]
MVEFLWMDKSDIFLLICLSPLFCLRGVFSWLKFPSHTALMFLLVKMISLSCYMLSFFHSFAQENSVIFLKAGTGFSREMLLSLLCFSSFYCCWFILSNSFTRTFNLCHFLVNLMWCLRP